MILLKIAHLVFKQVTYSLYQVRMFLPLSWWEQFTFILVRTIYLYLGENNLLLSWWEQFTFILVRTIYFSMRWWCLLCTIPTCLPVVGCHVPPHWYIIIPPLCEGGGGYTVLPLFVLPSVQDIFLSNCWCQKSDIWSQASYRYTILWVAFLDPSDSYFLFADLVGFYTHWTYIFDWMKLSFLLILSSVLLDKNNKL